MFLLVKPDPPYSLSMSVIDGPKYILHWDSKKISHTFNLKKRYEISYWETGKPLKVRRNRLLHTANRLCFCLPSCNFIFPLIFFCFLSGPSKEQYKPGIYLHFKVPGTGQKLYSKGANNSKRSWLQRLLE